MIDRLHRYQGCLLGLATGDALGTTLEFRERGTFAPLTDMVGGGPFNLKPGQWTDDTSMALCLAHSLLDCHEFSADDQIRRYNDWYRSGYMSSTGRCFDIGVTVSEAISQYLRTGNPYAGPTHPLSAGNGSLMRLAPVVMYYDPDLAAILNFAGDSSRTTHGALECVDACRYFAGLLHECFQGADKAAILTCRHYTPQSRKVQSIARGEYRAKSVTAIKGTGYVIDCLEAALWCFAGTDSYRAAVLAAANLGDDADTTAAVCGQIAGAYYGVGGIPPQWRQQIAMQDEILSLADQLYRR
jgi:ADP-ribosyl-[dinitrogen reductase] hydrolase